MKLKEKINDLFNILKKSIKKFPVTTISIYILTVIYAVCIGNNNVDWQVINRIATFTSIFAITTFLIETVSNKKKNQIIWYILALIWSAISTISIYTKGPVFGLSNEIFIHFVSRVICCYVISLIILSIYYNFKKSEKSFGSYLTSVVVSIFKTSLIYGILAIGLLIITSIFIFLILNGRHYILLGRIEILLLGMYYVPTVIYSLYNQQGEIGKFAKVVIKYILGTLVMVAFAIIYIYILKIFILRDIPSNQIFRILAALFVIGLPIWTMCSSFNEEKTFDKINNKMPLLFIPFIFLQIYSIGVRIGENGITEARYLCVMLIIFEIIYTIIYIKNKSKIEISLLVIIIFTVISTLVPFANMFKVSALSQYNILKKYDSKENLSKEEKSKLYGAYYYLEDSVIGKKYIENYELKNKEEGDLIIYEYNSKNDEYISADSDSEYITVEGYKMVYNVSASSYNLSSLSGYDSKGEEVTIDKIFKKVSFKTNNDKEIANVNMLNFIEKVIQHKNSIDSDFKYMNEIIVDENRKIILESIYINYNETTKEVSSYNFIGYLLEK